MTIPDDAIRALPSAVNNAKDPNARRWRVLGVVALVCYLVVPMIVSTAASGVLVWAMSHAAASAVDFAGILAGISAIPLAVVACILSAVAPTSARNKWLGIIWVAAFLVLRAVDVFVLTPAASADFLSIWSVAGIAVYAALSLGWWLMLRGRVAVAYLSLIAVGIVFPVIRAITSVVVSEVTFGNASGSSTTPPPQINLVLASVVGTAGVVVDVLALAGGAFLAAAIERAMGFKSVRV